MRKRISDLSRPPEAENVFSDRRFRYMIAEKF